MYTVSSSNIKDDGNFVKSQDPPLLDKLQKHMPNWTPKVPDMVVYTTVDEAHSSSIQDVGEIFVEIEMRPMHRQGRPPQLRDFGRRSTNVRIHEKLKN